MKRLAAVLLILLPAFIIAQNPMDKLYEKYAGQENVTSVNISSEMFKMIAGMKIDTGKMENNEAKHVMDAVSKMNGMKILTYMKSNERDNTFYNDIKNEFNLDGYVEMMSVKDGDSDVKFYAKKKGNMISEMLMIADENDETVLMNFSGLFDMKTISKLGQSMNMHGMDKLERLEEEKK